MKSLFIYCCGGFGIEVLKLARKINENKKCWKEICFIDDSSKEQIVNEAKVYSYDYVINNFNIDDCDVIVANGEPYIRQNLYTKVKSSGLSISTLIHPTVDTDYNNIIGEGSIICEGTILTDSIVIGEGVILNINSTIGHNAVIGNFVTISPSVNVSGNVTIGDRTYIGTATTIRDEIKIGHGTIVGLGSVVTKDINSDVIAYGVPCKEIKPNETRKVFK